MRKEMHIKEVAVVAEFLHDKGLDKIKLNYVSLILYYFNIDYFINSQFTLFNRI